MSDDIHMTISIPTDDEGYVLLKCEHCGTFFKGTPSDIQDDGVLHIFCPSCGLVSDSYITDDVLERAINMTKNIMNDMIDDMFKDLERHSKKSALKFKTGRRPPIRRLRANENMETKTLNKLCVVLECGLNDIAEFIPDEAIQPLSD